MLIPDTVIAIVFLVMLATTVAGALIAVNAKRLVRAVCGLCVCFIGVAGLYYYLSSPFVALMQILIYIGAVGVSIAFAVMLAEPRAEDKPGKQSGLHPVFGFVAGGMMTWGLVKIGLDAEWPSAAVKANDGSMLEVGKALLTTYSMVFELISIVLLVAIIGALALARERQGRSAQGEPS